MATKKPITKAKVKQLVKKPAAKKAAPKKKLDPAKTKQVAKKAGKLAADHWFVKLSKKAQVEYIKTHPNSKFAKGAKVKAVVKDVKKKPSLTLDHAWNHLEKAQGHRDKAQVKLLNHVDKLIALKQKHKEASTPAKKQAAKAKIAKAKEHVKSARAKFKHAMKNEKRAAGVKNKLASKGIIERVKATAKAAAKNPMKKIGATRFPDKKKVDKTAPKSAKIVKSPMKNGVKKATATVKKPKMSAKISKKVAGLSIAQKARLKNLKFTHKG